NLYFNRSITAARAGIEDFGDGYEGSHRGFQGIKTSTPEFLIAYMGIRKNRVHRIEREPKAMADFPEMQKLIDHLSSFVEDDDLRNVIAAAEQYALATTNYFNQPHRPAHPIYGEYNTRTFSPVGKCLIRLGEKDSFFEMMSMIFMAKIAGNSVELSFPPEMRDLVKRLLGEANIADFKFVMEGPENLFRRMASQKYDIIRAAGADRIDEMVYIAAAYSKSFIDSRQITGDAKVDMLTQFRQRSVTDVYSKHGDPCLERLHGQR
ncbi:hypothetical protein HY605_01730, partial [Candidatus Peregrinibacteria bacterium]|nr:hypothetical protein [Candidatus Peregrinibacteria bacterium]